MFLKYNVSNIKREKRLLNISFCTIESQKDDIFLLNLKTENPHNLNVGDIVIFNRNIIEVNDYIEADFLLKQNKIMFRSKKKLSLNDKVTMFNIDFTSDKIELIVNKIDFIVNEGYVYICDIIGNYYPDIKYRYYFYSNEENLDVRMKGWKIVGKMHDIVKVLNDTQINENGNIKKYYAGYYWLYKNDIVRIVDDIDKILEKYNSYNTKLKILSKNFTENSFCVLCNKYEEFIISETYEFVDYGIIRLDKNPIKILKPGESVVLRQKKYGYVFERDEIEEQDEMIKEINFNPINSKYIGFEKIKFLGKIYIWSPIITEINCEFIKDNIFKYSYENGFLSKNDKIEIENNSIINSYGFLNENINFYEYNESVNINLPLINEYSIELNDENIIKNYFDEKKNEIIPEIIDYEKRCFIPYYLNKNIYKIVDNITFNLFFRDRDENWITNDGKGWFQYKIDNNGNFNVDANVTNGDLLGLLDFVDDDVYYRKKKISKSFLRLSFYDTNNPLNQMLMFYSTIFLDTGELYTKYINSIDKKNNTPDHSLVNDETLGDNNLTVSFNITNKYDKNKSSEGFYLYLFPDGLKDNKRTIYMKAEFNHAGYGKTIPLIQPVDTKNNPLSFKDKNFPTSLISEDGNLKKFYEYLYIPITIEYKKDSNEFVYYFKYNNTFNNVNNEIIINLYEPKINPLD